MFLVCYFNFFNIVFIKPYPVARTLRTIFDTNSSYSFWLIIFRINIVRYNSLKYFVINICNFYSFSF